MTTAILNSEEILAHIVKVAGEESMVDTRVAAWPEGTKGVMSHSVWIRIKRERFKVAVRSLFDLDYPHMAVISGADLGDDIELLYHFYLFYGHRHKEVLVTIAVSVPKTDPTIPTISDLIPGALISEREKQEMLGVVVTDIPDSRRIFLPEDFPEGVYPWRKDETGIPEDMIKQLWKVGRPQELLEDPPPPKKAPAPKPEETPAGDANAPAPEAAKEDPPADKPAQGGEGS